MRLRTIATATRSVLLIVFGVLAASSPLAKAAITATTCVTPTGLGHIGVQLHLLTPSTECASGFAPGVHYVTAASVTFALSISALIAGVIGLALLVATSAACRRLARSVRDWVSSRWRLAPPSSLVVPERQRPALAPVRVRATQPHDVAPYRRGPPSGC